MPLVKGPALSKGSAVPDLSKGLASNVFHAGRLETFSCGTYFRTRNYPGTRVVIITSWTRFKSYLFCILTLAIVLKYKIANVKPGPANNCYLCVVSGVYSGLFFRRGEGFNAFKRLKF